ncbi:MAG: 6-bladed beta-propeller [Gemmatimonadetes bacterium]|nr:6-bladed beta-propeller [Gemmatimonadota bacterium]MYA64745.1 6-bladed beta-propeller [Gemmatimonadota bacterium]MYB97479.1 6-bladed beta-propeller [Gemmatimonadota bacterium]MYH52185.1 6-bladed beta-propeller [Gemmatimonadota bacterium]MYK65067.1 6-bladed beta-propeller [Gemmatimonadota bacterium]
MRHFALPITLFVPLSLACGDSAEAPATGDGANDPAGADIALAPVLEDVYTVGAMEGEDWEIFGRIRSVDFDENGNLHILDSQADRVVVVGPDGDFVRTVGKPGEGPGEFSGLRDLVVRRDGSYAALTFGSIHLFDADGEFTGTVPADISTGMPMRAQGLPDGRLVSSNVVRMNMLGSGGSLRIATSEEPEGRAIEVFSLEEGMSELLYTAWELPEEDPDDGSISVSGSSTAASISMRMSPPKAFVPGLHVGVLSDGRIAVVDSVGYRVKLVGMDGSVTGTLERPIAPTVVTEAIREAELERRRAAREEGNAPGGEVVMSVRGTAGTSASALSSLNPDNVQSIQVMGGSIEDMTFADEIPVIDAITVDWDDRVWIERTGENGQGQGPIDIMTVDGRYLGTLPADGLRTPLAFGPGGLAAFVDLDEYEVQTVRVVRLSLER